MGTFYFTCSEFIYFKFSRNQSKCYSPCIRKLHSRCCCSEEAQVDPTTEIKRQFKLVILRWYIPVKPRVATDFSMAHTQHQRKMLHFQVLYGNMENEVITFLTSSVVILTSCHVEMPSIPLWRLTNVL